jgi:hypothetical protein
MNKHPPFHFGPSVSLTLLACWFLPGLQGCGSSTSPNAADASIDTPAPDAPACPASCDDKNDCTTDSCDPGTGQCIHTALADGMACDDGKGCTVNDICQGGICYSGPFKTCKALDQCHVAGNCDPATGACTNPNVNNTTPCNDGLKCTSGDQCQNGVCSGTAICPATANCDENTGLCSNGADGGGYAFPTSISGSVIDNLYWPSNSNALAITTNGRVFAGGSFAGATDLGAGPMDTGDSSNQDVFLAQLDPSTGKAIWSTTFPGPENQLAVAFAANGAGQLGLLGPLLGTLALGSDNVITTASGDNFVLGASATDGGGLWVRKINLSQKPADVTGLVSLAGDPAKAGFVLCGTTTKAATDLLPGLMLAGGADVVVAGLDGTTGATNWALQIGGVNDEACNAVTVDSQSNIYVAGTYEYGSVINFGGSAQTLPVVDQVNTQWLFVARLQMTNGDGGAPTAAGVWARSFGNVGQRTSLKANALLPVSDGLVVAGNVTGVTSKAPYAVGGALFTSPSMFVAKLRTDTGDIAWLIPFGTNSSSAALGNGGVTALSLNSSGNIVLAGYYSGTLTLGDTPLPQATNQGAFVALLEETLLAQPDGGGTTTARVLAARGYSSAGGFSSAAGVATNASAVGAVKDTSLLLGQFAQNVDLGAPAGVLTSPAQPISPSTFLTILAP